jgi:periplasmic divalent cation tolerance protein
MSLIAVITTLPTREHAEGLARLLLAQGLVACAQMESIESLYVWEGDLQHDRETRLTLKAPASHYEAIETAILQRHPYDLPAIHAIRLERVHAAYGAWIRELEEPSPVRQRSCGNVIGESLNREA